MARDEAMMFPNERIKLWLANRADSEDDSESSIPSADASPTGQPDVTDEVKAEVEG